MEIIHQVKLKLENFEKCHFNSDSDCGIGYLYDFASALKSFIAQKVKDNEEAEKEKAKQEASAPEAPPAEAKVVNDGN